MFADEHGCAPMREHHQDESKGSRTSGVARLANFWISRKLRLASASLPSAAAVRNSRPPPWLRVLHRGHGFRPDGDMIAVETTRRSVLIRYR
jgi:hypothetical protein